MAVVPTNKVKINKILEDNQKIKEESDVHWATLNVIDEKSLEKVPTKEEIQSPEFLESSRYSSSEDTLTPTSKNLNNHISNTHSSVTWYKCPLCPYKNTSKPFRNQHVINKHTSWIVCKYCSYKTKFPGHFNEHVVMDHSYLSV